MQELYFCTDKKLQICSWEKGISELTGRTASQVLGQKYYDVFPRISVDNKDALSLVLRRGKALTLKQHPFHCLYGSLFADLSIRLVKVPGKKTTIVKVSLQPPDTCGVSKKLRQSKKLIDIGIIASTLAHGVRNPLNAIKGAVVYLREKYAGEGTLTEFTEIMVDEITRLEDFISKFLCSSVLETETKETDVNALLKKVEIFTSLQMYTHNIHSQYEFGTVSPILINSFYLEQAVLNVINNAIEAMQNGGQLTIKTSTVKRSGKDFVVISIADAGPGMSLEKLNALTSESKSDGRGFGLFITYEILRHYNGHIEMDSKRGVGTTISLFLPCRPAARNSP